MRGLGKNKDFRNQARAWSMLGKQSGGQCGTEFVSIVVL